MADLIGTTGRSFIAALALAEHMVESGARLIRAEAEARHLRGLLDHTMGQRDEARDVTERARLEIAALSRTLDVKVNTMSGLADELKIAERERDGYRADVESLTAQLDTVGRSCIELQCELDTARASRNDEQRFRLAAEGEVKRVREKLTEVIDQRDAEARARVEMRESLRSASERAESSERRRVDVEEQANALRVELGELVRQIEWLRRETGWPVDNGPSWLVNVIANKEATIQRLLAARDLQGTMP